MEGIVIRHATTSSFFQRILNQRPRSTIKHIIICSERQIFLEQLHHSINCEVDSQRAPVNGEKHDRSSHGNHIESANPHPLLQRTIAQLKVACDVQLTFCASLPALLAFLALFPTGSNADRPDPLAGSPEDQASTTYLDTSIAPILALVNPIELLKETTSFSAQGLSKTCAAAVEAAARGAQRLVIVECVDEVSVEGRVTHDPQRSLCNEKGDGSQPMGDTDVDSATPASSLHPLADSMDADTERVREDANDPRRDPWMNDIPILNSSTKTYGLGNDERGGWLGRTIKTKDVVSRWCRFQALNESVFATREAS